MEEMFHISISGMHCASCAQSIENIIRKFDGVNHVTVNFATGKATIKAERRIDFAAMVESLKLRGYHFITEKKVLKIKGINDENKATEIENQLINLSGVINIKINQSIGNFEIEYLPEVITIRKIIKTITDAGYRVEVDSASTAKNLPETSKEHKKEELKKLIRKFLTCAPLTVLIMVGSMFDVPFLSNSFLLLIFATVVQLWGGSVFHIAALKGIRHKNLNMNTLIFTGTFTSYIYSMVVTITNYFSSSTNMVHMKVYFDTSAMIITIVLLGRYLEARVKEKASGSITRLIKLRPEKAMILLEKEEKEVSVDEITKGDTVVLRPAECVPVDGEIIDGNCIVDESMFTGESLPVSKKPGDRLLTGTINISGVCIFKAIGVGSETALARIIKLVEDAQASKAPIQQLVDKVAAIFIPVVIGIAIVTFILWFTFGQEPAWKKAMMNFISVLIVACPCALGLATPMAVYVSTEAGAENGILIKDVRALELLHRIKAILLDKTGTITKNELVVTDIIPSDDYNEDDVLLSAAIIERYSQHPAGLAIIQEAKKRGLEFSKNIKNFTIEAEGGVKAHVSEVEKGGSTVEIRAGTAKFMEKEKLKLDEKLMEIANKLSKEAKTPLFVSSGQQVIGVIALSESVKDGSYQAVKMLDEMGIEVIMVTGDRKEKAEAIANAFGIKRFYGEVMPHQKVEIVKAIAKEGKITAMVGDGINDAPALAAADVGIAIGTGTDIAMETSDITVIKGDLRLIPLAIKLGNLTIKTIKENLFWAFFYNIIAIPVAAGIPHLFGGPLLNPAIASIAMSLSSICVVLNSLKVKIKTRSL